MTDDSDHPIFDEVEHDILHPVQAVRDWFHPSQSSQPETPAQVPATMAPERAATQEETMSLATLEAEIGQRVAAVEAAVHNEVGKLLGDLPAITAEVTHLAASPLGQLAVQAAEHLAAGVIPPEALAIVESGAVDLYGKILGLYNPQAAAAPAAPPQPAEAPVQ